MASSKVETNVLWSSAASLSLTDNNVHTSDAFTAMSVETWEAEVQLSADNAGTAAAGDYVDFWIAYTAGDILGDTGNDYDTAGYAESLYRIDTSVADPSRKTVPIRTTAKAFQIIAKANQGATRNVTIRVRLVEHLVA